MNENGFNRLLYGCSADHQAQEAVVQTQVKVDFSKMHFGCDGNSITAGNQWSKTVVDILGFATHPNVAVGSAKWACYDTQEYGSKDFVRYFRWVGNLQMIKWKYRKTQ